MKDILCPKFLKKSKKFYSKVEDYLNKKSSIEYIIKKLNEVDKLKFVLFSKEELGFFNLLKNPSLFPENSNDKNVELYWKKHTDLEETTNYEEELQQLRNFINNKVTYSKKLKKILELL